jgi:hypothetical protein
MGVYLPGILVSRMKSTNWQIRLDKQNYIAKRQGKIEVYILNYNYIIKTEVSLSYHSVQSLLSSRLLSKNLKIRIYKMIILPVFLYGCETWSLILREGHRLRVFENRVLRRIFGPKKDEVADERRKLHTRNFMICTLRQV